MSISATQDVETKLFGIVRFPVIGKWRMVKWIIDKKVIWTFWCWKFIKNNCTETDHTFTGPYKRDWNRFYVQRQSLQAVRFYSILLSLMIAMRKSFISNIQDWRYLMIEWPYFKWLFKKNFETLLPESEMTKKAIEYNISYWKRGTTFKVTNDDCFWYNSERFVNF